MDVLEDGYGIVYHNDYYIYLIYLDDVCFMHVVVYKCKSNI
jgi:hypothetical protein